MKVNSKELAVYRNLKIKNVSTLNGEKFIRFCRDAKCFSALYYFKPVSDETNTEIFSDLMMTQCGASVIGNSEEIIELRELLEIAWEL